VTHLRVVDGFDGWWMSRHHDLRLQSDLYSAPFFLFGVLIIGYFLSAVIWTRSSQQILRAHRCSMTLSASFNTYSMAMYEWTPFSSSTGTNQAHTLGFNTAHFSSSINKLASKSFKGEVHGMKERCQLVQLDMSK
jgi:hypothetical protein